MNCKPGDLAIIVRGEPEENIGRIVRVTHVRPCFNRWFWSFDGATLDVDEIDDNCLRPIRDPGSDAIDETLQHLPAPSLETV